MSKRILTFLLIAFSSQAFPFLMSWSTTGITNKEEMRAIKVEVIEHLSNGEIIESSERMQLFLKDVRKAKSLKDKTDLEILEQFVDDSEDDETK
jgi:hypothetical protein